jgi:aminoglycoside phosphotransferase (APT) family kinase protein
MNSHALRYYLRVINEQFKGPLRSLAGDAASTRLLHLTQGVLARMLAEAEIAPVTHALLRAACVRYLESPRAAHTTDDAAVTLAQRLVSALECQDATDTETLQRDWHALARLLLGRPDDPSRQLLADIVDEEWQYRATLEARSLDLTKQSAAAASASSSAILDDSSQRRLLEQLRSSQGESAALTIARVTPLAGGFSKQTILVDLDNTAVLPPQIVLRCDRPESPVGTSVMNEFSLLSVLHREGIKVPWPLLADSQAVNGAPIMALERCAGRIIGDGHHLREISGLGCCASTLARELAKLHGIPLGRLPDGVPGANESNISRMRSELDEFRRIWDQSRHKSASVDVAFDWLQNHLEFAGETKALTHGDCRFHNILVDDEGVVAILDWELASLQNPALDLGCAYHHVRQLMDWNAFLDSYRNAGGEVPARETLAFYILRYELLTASYLTKMENGFLSGASDGIDLAYAGSQLQQHNMLLLAQRLRMILAGSDF